MSTVNMNQAKKWSSYYGVECQLVAGSKPTNCKAIIYNGVSIKSSNMTGIELETLFSQIATGQDVTGYSVAKQKVCDAHGRSGREVTKNFIEQERTYATDDFMTVTQYYNRPLNICMFEYLQVYLDDCFRGDLKTKGAHMVNIGDYEIELYTLIQEIEKWHVENNKELNLSISDLETGAKNMIKFADINYKIQKGIMELCMGV